MYFANCNATFVLAKPNPWPVFIQRNYLNTGLFYELCLVGGGGIYKKGPYYTECGEILASYVYANITTAGVIQVVGSLLNLVGQRRGGLPLFAPSRKILKILIFYIVGNGIFRVFFTSLAL